VLQCGCECIQCRLSDGGIASDTDVCNDSALDVECLEENKENCGPQFSGASFLNRCCMDES